LPHFGQTVLPHGPSYRLIHDVVAGSKRRPNVQYMQKRFRVPEMTHFEQKCQNLLRPNKQYCGAALC
jgi:hypothetical protein